MAGFDGDHRLLAVSESLAQLRPAAECDLAWQPLKNTESALADDGAAVHRALGLSLVAEGVDPTSRRASWTNTAAAWGRATARACRLRRVDCEALRAAPGSA